MRQVCRNEGEAHEGGVTGSALGLSLRWHATTAAARPEAGHLCGPPRLAALREKPRATSLAAQQPRRGLEEAHRSADSGHLLRRDSL